mgnify:CR=1 FL=1
MLEHNRLYSFIYNPLFYTLFFTNIYKYLIVPQNLIEIDDEFIYIYNQKDTIKIVKNDIKEVKITTLIKLKN